MESGDRGLESHSFDWSELHIVGSIWSRERCMQRPQFPRALSGGLSLGGFEWRRHSWWGKCIWMLAVECGWASELLFTSSSVWSSQLFLSVKKRVEECSNPPHIFPLLQMFVEPNSCLCKSCHSGLEWLYIIKNGVVKLRLLAGSRRQVGMNCSLNGLTWSAPAGIDSKKKKKKKHLKEAMKSWIHASCISYLEISMAVRHEFTGC